MKAYFAYAVVAAVCAMPAVSNSQSDTDTRTISTSGEAVVYVVPDEVILSFGVQLAHPELAVAKQQVDERSKTLSQAVKDQGIEQRHFATDNLDVSLRYHHNDPQTSISAHVVSRSYMVTLKDIGKLDTMVDTILNNGANLFEGVQFRSTEMRKHRDSARRMAIKAAREKASELATVLDCNVGKPRTITESGAMWGGQRMDRGVSNVYQNVAQELPSSAVVEGESLPLGQIAIKATVNVTFDLVPVDPAPDEARERPDVQQEQ